MQYSLVSHQTQKAQFFSLAKLSSPKSEFQSKLCPLQDVKWLVEPAAFLLQRLTEAISLSERYCPSQTQQQQFFSDSQLGREAPRLPSRV